MTQAQSGHRLRRASAPAVALALLAALPAFAQEQPESRACGLLSVPAGQTDAGRTLIEVGAGILGWAAAEADSPWRALAAQLSEPAEPSMASAWRLELDGAGALAPSSEFEQGPVSQPYTFDLSFDLNALRSLSEQPFSRSAPGQVLDAVGVDNARRARLAAIQASPDEQSLSIVLFAESRSEPPGLWRPLHVATARPAPRSGDAAGESPLEIAFGEQWEGVLFAFADTALAAHPDAGTISRRERLAAWGVERVSSLRALSAALDGRVYLWRAGESGVVGAAPLRRGATERAVAANLRATLGRRLVWGRDGEGRALGTLGLSAEDREPVAGDQRLWVRFVTVRDRVFLVASVDEAGLAGAPQVLAAIE